MKYEKISFNVGNDNLILAEYNPIECDNKKGYMVSMWISKKSIPFRDLVREEGFIVSDELHIKLDIKRIISYMLDNNLLDRHIKRFEMYLNYICEGIDKSEGVA